MNLNLDETTGLPSSYDFLNNVNPFIIIVLLIIIVIYYLMFVSLGSSNYSEGSNKSLKILEIVLWCLFIGILLLNGIKYFLNLNISAGLKNVFTTEPEIDINIDTENNKNISINQGSSLLTELETDIKEIPEILKGKEVFHVQNNKYTYKDAKEICSGVWCRYGHI